MSASTTSANSASQALPAFLKQSKADIKTKFIDLEWAQRNRLLAGTQSPSPSTNSAAQPSQWSRLSGDTVTARNRYMNVEPYAQNRIKLKVPEGVNDYINASPIQLGKRRYIATQGPKETSVNHFYRMLAAEFEGQSKAVVVMLTQTHESGREKCFQYYPLSLEESPLLVPADEEIRDAFKGEVHLESVEEDAGSRCQVRRLRLRTTYGEDAAKEVEILHLLFSGWPDFLIPEGDDRAALIELISFSNTLNQDTPQQPAQSSQQTNGETPSPEAPPRIIHCSAGVGRSGTFIALDYLLAKLDAGELDDVPPDRDPISETVDMLRQQRMMMVQGESQFLFVYEVLRERWLARMEGRS